MSMAYIAQPQQQQQLEWLDSGTLAVLLDGPATNGRLMMGRFDVQEGEANTPAGIEGMFRETGWDKSTPRPPGHEVKPDAAIATKYGNVIVGPPR